MNFFNPVIKLMNSMKYTYKFLLIGIIFISTIAVISMIVISNNTEQINTIEERSAGAKYNLILKDILKYAQQHRGTSVSAFNGDEEALNSLSTIEQQVEEAFARLTQFEKQVAYDFNVMDKTNLLRKQWDEIAHVTTWDSTATIVEKHSTMTNLTMQTMLEISNNSKLIIGQSAESSNLVFTLIKTLPTLTENLGLSRATGLAVLNAQKLTPAQEQILTEKYYLIKSDIENVSKEMSTIFANADMKDAIETYQIAANEPAQKYVEALEEIIFENNYSIAPNELYSLGTSVIDAEFDMYDHALNFMNDLILSQADMLNSERTQIIIIELIILIVLLYLFIGFYLGIKQSISRMQHVTEQVAVGNLSVEANFETKDEMQSIEVAMNEMISSLNTIVTQISTSAQYVAAASEELHASVDETTTSITHVSETVEDMASGAQTQTETISDNTQALNTMATSVNEIASNTETISTLSNDTMSAAKEGNIAMQDSSKQMQAIQQSVEVTSDTITNLNNRSIEIGKILGLITGIADQTNLLSLNAAIEAARAGEHGKGFAVVANEVGNLAEQSKQSAQLVSELVQAIQHDTKQSVQMMLEVQENVSAGLRISDNTALKFEQILQSMSDLGIQIENVTNRSNDLASNTTTIVSSMESMMEVSEEHASISQEIASATEEQNASMEEIASSAVELARMAEELQTTVQRFTLK